VPPGTGTRPRKAKAKVNGTHANEAEKTTVPGLDPLVVSTVEYTKPVGKGFDAEDGKIVRKDLKKRTPTGTGRRHEFASFDAFVAWRKLQGAATVLVSGTFAADGLKVVFKHAETDECIAASKEHLAHREAPGVLIIDTDVKGPGDVAARFPPEPEVWTPTKLIATLVAQNPELADVPILAGWSTSSGVTLDGVGRDRPQGVRAYIPVASAAAIPDTLKAMHRRAVAAGLGWAFVNAAGYPLYRSIIDCSLATVTQPDFAAAWLGKGLVQDRAWTTKTGSSYLPRLEGQEEGYEAAQAALEKGIGAKVKPVREAFAKTLKQKHKVAQPEAVIDAMLNGVICGDMVIQFDAETVTVADLLDGRGAEFDGQDCLDPLEPDYRNGDTVGRFYWNEGLAPVIVTFAHGPHTLVLRYAAGAALTRATIKDAVRTLALTYYESDAEQHADKKQAATKLKTKIAAIESAIDAYIAKARKVAPGFSPRALPEQDGPIDDGTPDEPSVLDGINAEYAFVNNGGNVGIWKPVPVNGVYSVYKVRDWYYQMAPVTVPSERGPVPAALKWMAWHKRRAYDGIGYWPVGKEPGGMLNLFHGLAIEPRTGKWETLRAFLLDVICSGDEACMEYLLKLLAWKLQNPTLPPEVALVLRSDEEGVGKGTIGRLLQRWVGHAFTKAANGKYVFGDYNDCLLGALVVFLDEALFAGNPEQVKNAMAAITEAELVMNPKGKPQIKLVNMIFWIIATNNPQAVAAMISARRYFVLAISNPSMQDQGYRTGVHNAIDGDEALHMAHDLLGVDLTGWHPRDSVPQTAALAEQKRLSLRGPMAWWADVLEQGYIDHWEPAEFGGGRKRAPVCWEKPVPGKTSPGPQKNTTTTEYVLGEDKPLEVSKSVLYDAYRTSDHAKRDRGTLLVSTFNKLMVEMTGCKTNRHKETFLLPTRADCQQHFQARLEGKLARQGTVYGQFTGRKAAE
jgi:hypothetical protein